LFKNEANASSSFFFSLFGSNAADDDGNQQEDGLDRSLFWYQIRCRRRVNEAAADECLFISLNV